MAEQILESIRDRLEGPIDFQGQRIAEQLSTNSLSIFGLLAFLIGYVTQDIRYTVYTMAAGTIIAFLAIVPPWPVYNKNPVQWLPSPSDLAGLTVTMESE